ncbi:hypothetical protein DSM3645_07405 [Blastopirellula marina DSM 3645]|uniref:Uncharacterized protein n=1 Tax=Blastopirellula marina DSM 3645 TaxID=314230 RepID=A3ZXQ8_9BACT|nr:hypothetical protein DSM3645_07405 [Blastopirellula marina DSM 3645]
MVLYGTAEDAEAAAGEGACSRDSAKEQEAFRKARKQTKRVLSTRAESD